MKTAAKGDRVRVHYTGTLLDGRRFDSSHDRNEPIEFVIGDGRMIEGFDSAVEGLAPGQTKAVIIPCREAYGPRHEEMVFPVAPEHFPQRASPAVGQNLQMRFPDGQVLDVRVASVGEEILLDGNHPLAGEDLRFEVELVEIVNG